MTDPIKKLISSASQAATAIADMTDAASDGEIREMGNIHTGDTLVFLADSMRLLIEAMQSKEEICDEDVTQVYGAVVRFLEDRG